MGGKLDLFAFIVVAVTVAAVVINPTISKTIAALGGFWSGTIIAAA